MSSAQRSITHLRRPERSLTKRRARKVLRCATTGRRLPGVASRPLLGTDSRAAPPPQRWWQEAAGESAAPARLAESGDVADIPDVFWLPPAGRYGDVERSPAQATAARYGRLQTFVPRRADVIRAAATVASSVAVGALLLAGNLALAGR